MSAAPISEMTDRARDVFRMVVEGYLDSGLPVGSRTISKLPGISLSPASIRNVMQDLEESGHRVIVNLASKEYWRAMEGRLDPGIGVIEIDFREQGPNGLRFNSFEAKRARGMMARYICENRLSDAEALKGFDSDGYAYDRVHSDAKRWRFSRT